jgi:hypothetical protein
VAEGYQVGVSPELFTFAAAFLFIRVNSEVISLIELLPAFSLPHD